jgi:hypothetical protein
VAVSWVLSAHAVSKAQSSCRDTGYGLWTSAILLQAADLSARTSFHPATCCMCVGVVGSLIGDGIAQYSSSRGVSRSSNGPMFSYDGARAARLCCYSAVIGSPIGHYWFQFLDKVS